MGIAKYVAWDWNNWCPTLAGRELTAGMVFEYKAWDFSHCAPTYRRAEVMEYDGKLCFRDIESNAVFELQDLVPIVPDEWNES